jgi:hypothetical protein
MFGKVGLVRVKVLEMEEILGDRRYGERRSEGRFKKLA